MCALKMNTATTKWSRRYQKTLRQYLAQRLGASLQPAHELGCEAVALGLKTLDLAGIHEQVLTPGVSSGGSSRTRQKMIERANRFFAEAIVPIEKTHRATLQADVRINQLIHTLHQRTVESSAATRRLQRSIILRRGAEKALKQSGKRHTRILAELHRLQKRLRDLTHTCLSIQEETRRKTSCQLHDEISQTLIAIDLRLLMLKKAARASTASLKKEIANTQRLVEESVTRINQFARELGIQHKA